MPFICVNETFTINICYSNMFMKIIFSNLHLSIPGLTHFSKEIHVSENLILYLKYLWYQICFINKHIKL